MVEGGAKLVASCGFIDEHIRKVFRLNKHES